MAGALWWDQPIKIWDTVTWREVASLARHHGTGEAADGNSILDWSDDDRQLLAGTGGGWVIAWDTRSGREVRSFPAHTANVRCLDLSSDDRRLITGSDDNTVKVWDAQTGALLLVLNPDNSTPGVIFSLKWSPDGRKILAGAGDESFIWDATRSYDMAENELTEALR